jgi:ectoine hydroxylase-related dioxygenase (phytanoyl-CoA dioxygenase family)
MHAIQEQFDEQGYVLLKGVFKTEVLDAARSELQVLVDRDAEKLLDSGRVTDAFSSASFETRLFRLYEKNLDIAPKSFRPELHLAGLFDVFFNAGVLDLVSQFLGNEIRLYPNYTVRPKFPEWEGTEVLWHQDGGYTAGVSGSSGVRDLKMVNVWAPIVPVTVHNGCMEFAPGTHRLGVVPHEKRDYYLEIASEQLARHVGETVAVELEPGDAVLFHNLLFHRGLPNLSDEIRWSCDWRYQDANQPTMRKQSGHLARSRKHPERVVASAQDWVGRTFS